MKRLLALATTMVVLTACSSTEATSAEPKVPKTRVEVVTSWKQESTGDWREVRINGRSCIQLYTNGISCDWSDR